MMVLLFQANSIDEGIRQLQEGFRSESSIGPVLWSCVGIVLASLVVLLISRIQKRTSGELIPDDPKKLFQSLMERMELADSQRVLLESLAKTLRLKHPAGLLLAPKLFDEAAEQWSSRFFQTGSSADSNRMKLKNLRDYLFAPRRA